MDSTVTNGQALPVGTRLEEFVVERVLGSGGFGITYLARDENLERQVVIKENLPGALCFRDPGSLRVHPREMGGGDEADFRWSLENFAKEGAMLARLDHSGIVKVLRSFSAFGTGYFVMPYVEGETLDRKIERRKESGEGFTEDEVLRLLNLTLGALGYLHDRGIYHRDIKPGNILITEEGLPVLIDFGAARQRLSERSMTVVESAGYTAYEQLESRGNVGPWTDLYALGGTVVKMIKGEAPPKAMNRVRKDPYRRLAERRELEGRYGRRFLLSIDRALEVEEGERWQSAGEWVDGLRWEGGVEMEERTSERGRAPVERVAVEVVKKGKAWRWVLLAVALMGLMVWGAERARLAAEAAQAAAEEKVKDAEAVKAIAEEKVKDAEAVKAIAEEKVKDAEAVKAIAEEKAKEAEVGKAIAEKAAKDAEAEKQAIFAKAQKEKEERAKAQAEAEKQAMIAKAQKEKEEREAIVEEEAKKEEARAKSKAGMLEVDGGALPKDSQVPEKTVERFWVGKYEVTWGEWKEVREWAVKKQYEMEEGRGGGEPYPVTHVNWYSAVKWCNARSEKEGLMPVYVVGGVVYRIGDSVPTVNAGANGYRLPREGEWEWAARGGLKGKRCEFSGSRDFREVGWSWENSGGKTHEVGKMKMNELGIYDMSGNVSEWCFDQWEDDETHRVYRGGSWDQYATRARVSHREYCYTKTMTCEKGVGFRVVRSSGP